MHQYEQQFIRNKKRSADAPEIFLGMLSLIFKTWDEFLKNQTEGLRTTTDMLNFLYVNPKSCLFQHKIGSLLQSSLMICRGFNLKSRDGKELSKKDQDVFDQLMQFPVEPDLKKAGCLSACFGLRC